MKKYLLIIILLLAAVLRFYKLDSYPALNADEAAIGYNAYSLIQTGKDEHGNPWPVHFQSFGDYKPGLYFYLVLPFVKVLGLNELAVRIPGATLGVLTVLVVYLLVGELFKGKYLALIASFLLAISPWHLHFSRGGWEVNASTFFITAGIWLFVKYINSKSFKYLAFSILHFALSLYTYHAARIVVPLLGLGFLVIYWKEIFRKENIKSLVLSLLLVVLLLFPLAKDLIGPAGISRVAGVGLFADPGPLNRINEQRGEHADFKGVIPRIFHNKAVNYGLAFLQNWASHFHGEFLFLSGDAIQRNKVPETGQLYLFEILTIAIGLIMLIKNLDKSAKVIFLWLIVAPVASALTFQSPHALRAHNMVIPLVIISVIGLQKIFNWLSARKRYGQAFVGGLIIVIAWFFARYIHMYWIHMAKEYPFSSQYGLKELVSYVKENQDKYQKIWITDKYDQPYVLFLFYLKYPPQDFQNNHVLTARDKFGFSTVRDFDKFHFEAVKFDKIRPENPNSLIVGAVEEIPQEANIVKEIYGTNDFKYFRIVVN